MTCDICGSPDPELREDVCLGCLGYGEHWAHKAMQRLWNLGMTAKQIATELGYSDARVVLTTAKRLRHRGWNFIPHKSTHNRGS